MNLNTLHLFLTVAHDGSFQKAAEHQYLTQRAVSKKISKLEEELNVRLFDRDKNRIELTPAGHYFVKRAREILNDVNDSASSLQLFAQPDTEQLNIGYISAFEGAVLRKNILQYQENTADSSVIFNVLEEDIEKLFTDLATQNLDCAYIFDYGAHHDYKAFNFEHLPITTGRMAIGVSQNSPLAHHDKITLADLNGQQILYYSATGYDYLKQGFYATLSDFNDFTFNFIRVQTFEQMQLQVSIGNAVALFPSGLLQQHSAFDENIVYLPLEPVANQQFSVELIYSQRHYPPVLRRYLSLLSSENK